MRKRFLVLISIFILIIIVDIASASDVLVWQGQYYTGTSFNTGTYEFNFSVYDALTGGNICYSNKTNLTTGNWGEWKTEQSGVSSACNNVSKDYYLNININGIDQALRRRLIIWNFLRKHVDEMTTGKLQTVSQVIAPIIQADTQIIAPIVNTTQVLASNITTTETGFFSYLGSLTSKINKLFAQSIDVNNINVTNISLGGSDKYLASSGAGNLELVMTTPASSLNIKSGSGSDSSEIRLTANSVYLTGSGIGLYGSSELWGSSNVYSTSENAFVVADDLSYEQTLRVDTINQTLFAKKIQGIYYSNDGSQGITNTADYHVCTSWAGASCSTWCTLRIKNGLIVGCA